MTIILQLDHPELKKYCRVSARMDSRDHADKSSLLIILFYRFRVRLKKKLAADEFLVSFSCLKTTNPFTEMHFRSTIEFKNTKNHLRRATMS